VDNTKQSPTVLSLCTGYGGFELALKRVFGEIKPIAYVEIEAFAVANLVDKMEAGRLVPAPVWTDLKTFNASVFRGKVDILTGGYPCQPFSGAGKRKGTEDSRHLWPYIVTIIKECQPRWLFFENVEGHISLGICEVLSDLEGMGYMPEVGIFSASEVGAPHQRKRVFVLAHCFCKGLQGHSRYEQGKRRPEIGAHRPVAKSSLPLQRWPSRPNQPQHDWEEPRVVNAKLNPDWVEQLQGLPVGWTQVSSFKNGENRIDRLRLLGNGIVPQKAEKAFRVLYDKLLKPEQKKPTQERLF